MLCCIRYLYLYFRIVYIVIIIVFKLDVDVVNVMNFIKIYFLLNGFVWGVVFYDICLYVCCCVFIKCVISVVICVICRVMWLGCDFVERYFIWRYEI